jgi:hypothetical protein
MLEGSQPGRVCSSVTMTMRSWANQCFLTAEGMSVPSLCPNCLDVLEDAAALGDVDLLGLAAELDEGRLLGAQGEGRAEDGGLLGERDVRAFGVEKW